MSEKMKMWFVCVCLMIFVGISGISAACQHPTLFQNYKSKPGTFRIVGGSPAKPGEFRGQVSLQNIFHMHVCAGVLIDPLHILTVAHCHQSEKKIGVVMGDDVLITYQGSETRQIRKVQHFVPHPKFSRQFFSNDVAVIRVDKPFEVTDTFGPMYRSESTPVIGTPCTVVGWGCESNDTDSPISMELLKTGVDVVDINFCNSSVSFEGAMKPGMLCAGKTKDGGHDACRGDSGGLLTCGNKGELSGIISFGNGCGLPEFPGIYTDISMYKDWIDEVLSTEKLPDYMYSPFAQQEAYQSDGNAENNAAIVPTIQGTAILMTFLPVIISTFT